MHHLTFAYQVLLVMLHFVSRSRAFISLRPIISPIKFVAPSISSRFVCMSAERIKVKKIFESDNIVNSDVIIKGWVRTVRDQKKFAFIEVNDGSTLSGIQAVIDDDIPSFSEVKRCTYRI